MLGVTLAGKDLGVARLDNTTAAILRMLRERGLSGHLCTVDSSVVAGYEAQTGMLLPPGLESETGHLELCSIYPIDSNFLDLVTEICREVDPAFRRAEDTDSILSERLNIQMFSRQTSFNMFYWSRRFDRVQLDLLEEAIQSRPIQTVAIANNGMPVEMVGPDPRHFAILHYASEVAGFEFGKERAYAVGRLVEDSWPEKFSPAILDAFPEFAAHVKGELDLDEAAQPSAQGVGGACR